MSVVSGAGSAASTGPEGSTSPGGRRARLRLDRVVTAALEVAGTIGVDRMTMKDVAAHLGVGTMSLYHYVSDKSDLLTHMVSRLYEGVELPPATDPWRDQLASIATQIYRAYLGVPGLGSHVHLTNPPLASAVRVADGTMAVLIEAGRGGRDAMKTALVIVAYAANQGQASARRVLLWREHPDRRDEIAAAIAGDSDTQTMRTLRREALFLPYDEVFEHGLDLLLDGLVHRLGQPGRVSPPGAGHPDDATRVRELLGRTPRGAYEVVVRDPDGTPVVLRNAPLLDDGTPMPTRYWLVGPSQHLAVSRLEAAGGVRRAEAGIDPAAVADAHARYAAERDAELPPDHRGPRPTGGVGGTRMGVKCLHAHYGWYLAGGDDPVGRWVADALASAGVEGAVNVAAIDLGSNSVRLLVTDGDGRALVRRAEITRLGADLAVTGRLSPQGCAATLEVLRRHRATLDEHGVGAGALRVVATAAARRASDADAFVAEAAAVIGVPVQVLTGDEEGRLSFAGATADLSPDDGPFLVVDIGGGSTELVVGTDRVEASVSIDLGCVTLTTTELHHDPPRPEELTNAIGTAADAFTDAWIRIPELRRANVVVGVAGTITTLAAVELGLAAYDRDAVHGLVLDRAAVEDAFRTLATEPLADRVHNPGLPRDRADVIVGGLCLVVALMRNLPAHELRVADADLLDVLAASLRP